eukprot:2910876-Alexandrium_andersonii.AAC.1
MLSSCSDWRSASSGVSPIRAAAACTRASEVPLAEPARGVMPSAVRITRFMPEHWWIRGPAACWRISAWLMSP